MAIEVSLGPSALSKYINTPRDSPSGQKAGYKCLAATGDGRFLVSGGKSRFIHLWNLDSRTLTQVIELPNKFKEIKNKLSNGLFEGDSSIKNK